MADELRKLPGDDVPDLDPVGFAVKFTRAMRRQRTAAFVPSLRTSLAIPKLLAARALRLGGVTPRDYVWAATVCTPPADQDLANAVARAIVFPEQKDADAPVVHALSNESAEPAAPDDPLADILGDLASLDLDLDALDDLGDLDALLAADEEEDPPLGAFDLFETLYSSADPAERALGELIHLFGGPAELEGSGIRTLFLARVWVARQLLAIVGQLRPDVVAWGVAAGFGPDLRRACTLPWELAGVLAGEGSPDLAPHLEDLLQHGNTTELGRTLAFLSPHDAATERREAFATAALARALDLTDFAELVVGLGEWIDPPEEILVASIASGARRAIEAGAWLQQTFGVDLRPDLFVRWYATQARPDLGQLTVVAVPCDAWSAALKDALQLEVEALTAAVPTQVPAGAPVHAALIDTLQVAKALVDTGYGEGMTTARRFATEVLLVVPTRGWFLPLLDALIERGAVPHAVDRVLAKAVALGVPEEEVLDRLGKALEQLRRLVLTDSHDADRYQRLIHRIHGVPPEMMEQLCQAACAAGNLEAMAALLAVDMGAAAALIPEEMTSDALGYKGIGGGANLLKQWFTHRSGLSSGLKGRIKEQVKAALLGEALDWMGKGDGSGERGLIPQQQTRPFRAGDGLESLDLDRTLESIVASGRPLDQVTEEDLFASDTARGRAALVVLIDISGSMSGGELAVCAIATVMLLGKLLPSEVALAVFESDTHVIKRFTDDADLDAVADQVLELQATGGTRADAALTWAADELAGVSEADVRVLFLLSDFAFFEGEQVLRARCERLAEQGARLLAASHGYTSRDVRSLMLETMGGELLEMTNLDRLPELLLQALTSIGDG